VELNYQCVKVGSIGQAITGLINGLSFKLWWTTELYKIVTSKGKRKLIPC